MPTEHHIPTLESLQEKYRRRQVIARRYLARGLLFLIMCLVAGQLIALIDSFITSIASESFIIIGWVAMWRPIEIYLYELPEIRQEIKHIQQVTS